MKTILLSLILVLAGTAAYAETFRWTDQNGTIHFSDLPSAGTTVRTGTIPSEPVKQESGPVVERKAVPSVPPSRPLSEQPETALLLEHMQDRMQKDENIMGIIRSMQDDPEVRKLVGDPAILEAVLAGDIGALLDNPGVLKLLSDPRVREIEKKLQAGEKK